MLIYDGNIELVLSNFNNNGLGYLKDFRNNPKIIKSLNGNFQLTFEYVKSGINSEYLKELNIIKAWHDNDWELFRIQKVIQKRNSIEVLATQLALFDLSNNFLEDVRPTNLAGANALQYLLDNTKEPHNFKATGDNTSVNTSYFIRKTVIEAIVSSDNSLVNRWNGEVDYHNLTIGLYNKLGNDNNVFIQYGKNLKDFSEDIDISTIVTRILPLGAEELMLPEKYIDSPRINDYPFVFIKTITFSDVMVDENTTTEEAYQQLRSKCQTLFEQGIDLPSINVKVDWQDLSSTLEYYEKYNVLERIKLGDTVTLKTDTFTYKTRVIKTVYDVLMKKYTNFELGSEKASFISENQNVINNVIDSIGLNPNSLLAKAKDNATQLITSAMGGYVYKTQSELFIMDTDNPNTATKVWRWNLNGLGYSSTGINGPYGIAITQDGQIVADYITTGQMSVNRISGLADELSGMQSIIQLNNSNITSIVQGSGGINRFKNTRWYQNLYDWEVVDGTVYEIIDNADTQNNTQSKRELHLISGKISQQFEQILNNEFTITFLYKKDTNESCYVRILWNDTDYLELLNTNLATSERKEISVTYNALNMNPQIEFVGEIYIADLVCNDGISKVWSLNSNEKAGLNSLFDLEGLKINDVNEISNFTLRDENSTKIYKSNVIVAEYGQDTNTHNINCNKIKNGTVTQIGGKFFYTGGD